MSCYFACNGFETDPTLTPLPQLSTQKFQPIASKPSLTFRGRKIFMSQWWIYREGGGGGAHPCRQWSTGMHRGVQIANNKIKIHPTFNEKA